ncbi:PREDICTED: transcription factor bHLH100-like [Fragaria vesca subsp. vesca]|uniref:transcription factor bHLH100-like n=1 Tax=Fragaria vesca subsp. vesca TaxID=101020 RepID=UPI0002C374D3|nr:PREDICTED: transcription factor bHLH100-like [Fragaria vesca subsp. vesca]
MKKCTSETSSKLDRKTVERNRRIQMKGLCFKLASMVPPQYFKSSKSKEMMTQQSQLDLAASYIKQLTERIENLKERKEKELKSQSGTSNKSSITNVDRANNKAVVVGSRLPIIKMSESGPSIEVMLISGLNKNFMFYEVISVLQEEGAEVVSANFSTVGDKIFHTLHAQVKISRVGVETTRVWQRLQDLIY